MKYHGGQPTERALGAQERATQFHSYYIKTKQELLDCIDVMEHTDTVAIDTEFMREKTYWPKLCLLQIAFDNTVVVIDTQTGIDLTPLERVLCNPNIIKVLHSGSQDLEILYKVLNQPVTPIFDTQSAGALIGLPDQAGYGALIAEVLGLQLPKSDSFSDWSRRPLTQNQIKYAEEDVIYLLLAYPFVKERLTELGRDSWLEEEFAFKASTDYLVVDTREQYRKVKRVGMLGARQAAVAREVAAWRERTAQRFDLPKRWILPDESVIEVAKRQPTTERELSAIRGMTAQALKQMAIIIEAVRVGQGVTEDELPQMARRRRSSHEIDASVDLAAALVRKRARENDISVTQLASRPMIEEFIYEQSDKCQLLQGWRKTMVGEELLELLAGNLILSLADGILVVTKK